MNNRMASNRSIVDSDELNLIKQEYILDLNF